LHCFDESNERWQTASTRRGLNNSRNSKSQFSDRQLHIYDKRHMGAQNFDFAPKFFQNGGFLAPNFVFLDDDTKEIF